MILVDGEKYACEQCIRGHRSSVCKHIRRPLVLVRARGRPLTDSFQRIAIYAEEIKDEDEKKKALENNDNSKNNLLVAKSVQQPSCCKSKSNSGTTSSKQQNDKHGCNSATPESETVVKTESKPQMSSCCSKKADKVTKPRASCRCCSGDSCNKNSSPVYILKASKRQVFNVDKNSLRLLDPVVEIPNSKVGLDIIERVSRSKHKNSCGQKILAEQLNLSLNNSTKMRNNSNAKTSNVKSGGDIIQFQVEKKDDYIGCEKKNIPLEAGMNMLTSDDFNYSLNKLEQLDSQLHNSHVLNNLNEVSIKEENDNSNGTQNYNRLVNRIPQTENGNAEHLSANGFLYDLYIANTCTVPGTCLCLPDMCKCEGCTEHIKYKNSDLSVKEQFDEFQFPTIDSLPEYPIQKITNGNSSNGSVVNGSSPNVHDLNGIMNINNNLTEILNYNKNNDVKPYGKVEIQSSVPQFEQEFLNKLYQESNSLKTGNDRFNSPLDETDECFCDPQNCCCYNCAEHGIINGIRISDGSSVLINTDTVVNIQLKGSQFPLYSGSSSSSVSTPSGVSPDYSGGQTTIRIPNTVPNPDLESIMNSNLSDRNKWHLLHHTARMANTQDSINNTIPYENSNNLFFNSNVADDSKNYSESLSSITESDSINDANLTGFRGNQEINRESVL